MAVAACSETASPTLPLAAELAPAAARVTLNATTADVTRMQLTIDDALGRVLSALGSGSEVDALRARLADLQQALKHDDAGAAASALRGVTAAIVADGAAHAEHAADLSAIELALGGVTRASRIAK